MGEDGREGPQQTEGARGATEYWRITFADGSQTCPNRARMRSPDFLDSRGKSGPAVKASRGADRFRGGYGEAIIRMRPKFSVAGKQKRSSGQVTLRLSPDLEVGGAWRQQGGALTYANMSSARHAKSCAQPAQAH